MVYSKRNGYYNPVIKKLEQAKRNLCPFCGNTKSTLRGNTGRRFVNGLDHPIEQHRWYVQCNKCKAKGGIASGKVNLYENGEPIAPESRKNYPDWQTTDADLARKALDLWNRRTT